MNTLPSPQERSRNRTLLLLIMVVFLGTALVAATLRLSGWRPSGNTNHGELLQPYGDLRRVTPRLLDGGEYAWAPVDRIWRIAVAPPPGCDAPCVDLSRTLDTVWQLFGHRGERVHTLWIGEPPAGAVRNASWHVLRDDPELRAGLPRVDDPAGVPVYIIDPYGFVVLRYAPGFDPAHLREDMSRLLKLR